MSQINPEMQLNRQGAETPSNSPRLGVLAVQPSSDWLTLKEASRRSGISVGHLARKCGETWFAAGLAETVKPAAGGKPSWHIHVSADPSFAAVKFPDQLKFDVRDLTEAQRRELFSRKTILDLWQTARAGGSTLGFTEAQITEQFCNRMEAERDLRLSPRSLHRWHSSYRAEGPAGLIDRRWLNRQDAKTPSDSSGNSSRLGVLAVNPFFEALKNYYLSPRQISKRSAWECAMSKASENGWESVGYRAACLYLDKIPLGVRVKNREGSDAYNTKCEPSIARDYTTLHSNEQLVGDHHQFDVIVRAADGSLARPWLTAWMDMRSRLPVGHCVYAHDPNSNSILSALRGACLVAGVPELLYIDNGKDYGSFVFHGSTKMQRRQGRVQLDTGRISGILNHLGIKSRFCWAYHGQSKPIERWFNTVEARFSRGFNTYCGRSPAHKPEGLQANLDRGQAPLLSDFVALFDRWVESYSNSAHRGQGMGGQSPQAIFDSSWNGFSKRTTSEEMLDLLLTRQTKALRVNKNGVNFSGLFYGQFDPALMQWLGKEVYLRIDERDLKSVSVWSPEDRFITLARSNQLLPANAGHELLSAAIGEKKRHRKLARDYHQNRLRIAEDLPDRMIRAANRQIRPERPEGVEGPFDPPPIKPIRSRLESELPAVRRAIEMHGNLAATGTDGAPSPSPRFEYIPNPSADAETEEEEI